MLGAQLGVLGTTGLSFPDTDDASTAVVFPAVAISPAPTPANSAPVPMTPAPCCTWMLGYLLGYMLGYMLGFALGYIIGVPLGSPGKVAVLCKPGLTGVLLGSLLRMAPCLSATDCWELGLVLGSPLDVVDTTGWSCTNTDAVPTTVVLPAVAVSPAPTSSNSTPVPMTPAPCCTCMLGFMLGSMLGCMLGYVLGYILGLPLGSPGTVAVLGKPG